MTNLDPSVVKAFLDKALEDNRNKINASIFGDIAVTKLYRPPTWQERLAVRIYRVRYYFYVLWRAIKGCDPWEDYWE